MAKQTLLEAVQLTITDPSAEAEGMRAALADILNTLYGTSSWE